MADQATKARAREAAARGEAPNPSDMLRTAGGLIGLLARYVGKWVYAETYKMNYRGVLIDIVPEPQGGLVLVFSTLIRVGEWGDDPAEDYEEPMEATAEHPRLLRWDSVTDFGLQQAHWKTSATKSGRRG